VYTLSASGRTLDRGDIAAAQRFSQILSPDALPTFEKSRLNARYPTAAISRAALIGSSAPCTTPNLAARLQALATPNTLVIGDATRRQVGGLFELADLGPQALAGFAEPQSAWRVVGESGMLSRFEALRSGKQRHSDLSGEGYL
jgi:hypothetical protein